MFESLLNVDRLDQCDDGVRPTALSVQTADGEMAAMELEGDAKLTYHFTVAIHLDQKSLEQITLTHPDSG